MKKYTMKVWNKDNSVKEFNVCDKLNDNEKKDAIFRAKKYKNNHSEVIYIYLCKNNELILRLA